MTDLHLPPSLAKTPDLDRWIHINPDETVTVLTGKVEIGQGIKTVIAQIAAEELDVSVQRTRVQLADTELSPDEGYTAGSTSTYMSGGAVRQAAAEVRALLVGMAAVELDAPAERLRVDDGVISDTRTGDSTTYWKLMGGRRFERQATGNVQPKPPEEYTVVGQPVPRLDIPDKVAGRPVFVDDMDLPGMLHARVVRPPDHAARLERVDVAPVQAMLGVVTVVHDGSFLAVAAEREEQAVAAAQRLSSLAEWSELASSPQQGWNDETLYEQMLAASGQRFLVVDGVPTGDPIPALEPAEGAVQTLNATYYRPFLRHASLGPSSAAAHWQDDHLTIWTHSQGVYPLRMDIAQVLGMTEEKIRIIHRDGPGCYGHNGADDVALDAALVARAAKGRPVLLKWTRSQENLWEPFGPAMVMQLQASLDDAGNLLDWSHETKSYSHSARPRPARGVSSLIAAWHLAEPLNPPAMSPGTGFHGGIHRNADPPYAFPNRRIVKHFLPDSPLRHSALRSLGAFSNIFASESFVDEVCMAAGADPVEFRLRYLTDPRSQAVVRRAAEKAGWRTQPREFGHGQGIAFSRYKNTQIYSAVVAEVEVDSETGVVTVPRAVAVADAGRVINPDGLRNQLQGGVLQSASWTLMESVAFDGRQIGGVDWESYPVFRFADAPVVEVEFIDRPGEDPLGAGEATVGPASAAIANAIYDAIGLRLRRLPFTPERVLDALAQR